MPRETEEEMFRRVQSEARREARLEQQRDLKRRRQRKIERREKREEEVRSQHEQSLHRPAIVATSMRGRGRAIMVKPKKKVLNRCLSVTEVRTTQGFSDSDLATTETLHSRDVATATDPVYTNYPTRSRREEKETRAVLPEDQARGNSQSSDCEPVELTTVGMHLAEERCEADLSSGVSKSDVAMADWQRA